jgi:hypothetical protein
MSDNAAQATVAKIAWFEVPAADTQRARGFYDELFGWQFQPCDLRGRRLRALSAQQPTVSHSPVSISRETRRSISHSAVCGSRWRIWRSRTRRNLRISST